MLPTDPTQITFKIDGPRLKESVPLLEMVTALQEFHYIIDKAYLAKSGARKLYQKDRQHYSISATDFRRGSLSLDLVLFAIATTQSLPNFPAISYKDLWGVAKGSYDFLKAVIEKRSSGIEPVITINGDNNAPIIIGNTISINNTVFNAADRAEPHFKRLTSIIKPKEIDTISSFDKQGVGFELTEKDKDLFNPRTRIDKEVFTVECDIFKFDKLTNRGKLRVFDGQEIPGFEFAFKPLRVADSPQFIMAMARDSVKINVLREIEVHTTGVERIAALRVISIEDFRTPSLFD